MNRKRTAVLLLSALSALLAATGCAQDAAEAAAEAEAEADAAPAPDAVVEADAAPQPDPETDPESDPDAEPEADAAASPDPEGPGFAELYAALPSLNGCVGGYCHHTPNHDVHDMSASAMWTWLTGPRVPERQCADDPRPLIAPGDPEGSLLWAKVAPGVEVCGSKMPLTDGAGLTAEDAERIRAWIAAGAKP